MTLDEEWIRGNAKCSAQFENGTEPGYCGPVWDRYLCWPPTPPAHAASIRCPPSKGIDTSKFATRWCRLDGSWQWKEGSAILSNESLNFGWTNYSQCFPPGIRELLDILNSQSEHDAQRKLTAAEGTRVLEMLGLSVSMVSLIISLLIFCQFRNLRNNRTRIHRNLFIAMFIQVLVRLIVYIDQYISRSASLNNSQHFNANLPFPVGDETSAAAKERKGIEDTAYVCESFYVVLEYARTAMFFWMLVEGLYLHNMITVSVFQERLSVWFFYCLGWGSPAVLTLVWAVVTFDKFRGITCWWGYNLSPYFWILEGPRLAVIILNLIFLLNIMRVLVTKLRESSSSEAQQVRKAVRAAIVLLPLLGITNSLQMIHSPLNMDAVQFAIWSYVTAFLTSFQGFFCTLIYCFLNGEVQRSVRRGVGARFYRRRQRTSMNLKSRAHSAAGFSTIRPAPPKNFKPKKNGAVEKAKPRRTPSPRRLRDPMEEYWNEAELSSHNHVDIEHIEIPDDYYIRHGGRINASRCESVNKLVLNPASASSSTSSPTIAATGKQATVSSVVDAAEDSSPPNAEIDAAQNSYSKNSVDEELIEKHLAQHAYVAESPGENTSAS